jgi:GTP-binding protein
VNIVDTPGHADFAGEVDRILSMVDGVCLVVDGGEGVMSQTKYVMERAVHANLQPIVFLNKLDREGGLTMVESGQVETEIFDLFIQLGANDEQLEYPTYYGSAKMGWVTDNLDDAVKVVKGAASPDAYGMEGEGRGKGAVGSRRGHDGGTTVARRWITTWITTTDYDRGLITTVD